ncbi:MAG: hypothetical protein WBM00_04110 [Solirubrobacterales bacterium]
MTAKEKLLERVTRLSEAEAGEALRLLEARGDPVGRLLGESPLEDEESKRRHDRDLLNQPWAREGIEQLHRGELIERPGAGISELDIRAWTCFSCGGELTQAHPGDYFHTNPDSKCFDPIPVPTSVLEAASEEMARADAKLRDDPQAHGGSD